MKATNPEMMIVTRPRLVALALIVSVGGFACAFQPPGPEPAKSATPEAGVLPDTLVRGESDSRADSLSRLFDRFLAAYNTASQDQLRAFYDAAFEPGFVEQRFGDATRAAGERIRMRREYGPLELNAVDESGPGRVFWARGTVTGGWLGFEYTPSEDPPGRIGRASVWRLLPGHHPTFRALPRADLRDSLDAFLSSAAREGFFSGVVLVLEGDEPVFEEAYGYADRERGVPNTPETLFNIASAGKMFTGVALLQLAEAGAVALDDPLSEWVPEYPADIADRVTLEQLLTHTSGIELDEIEGYPEVVESVRTLDQALAAQLRFVDSLDTAALEPGAGFDYTNEGIDLAGVVVARASGRPWRDYLRDRVLSEAGMAPAFHASSADGPVATGYALERDAEGGPLRRVPVSHDHTYARPAGQLFATAGDLGRFVRALLDHDLLGARWVERMTSPQVQIYEMPRFGSRASYGYAMTIERRGSVHWFGHAGAIPSGGAQVRHYPEADRTLVVLSNFGVYAPYIVAGRIEELIAGSP